LNCVLNKKTKKKLLMRTNETVRCLIIDDEPIARRIIKSHLAKVTGFTVEAECSHALEGYSLLQSKNPDLLFLDIQMPQLNGLDFLRALHKKPRVIIVSAHRDFALEGFELDVIDYLLKPVSFERFLMALDKFQQRQADNTAAPVSTPPEKEQHLFIRANRKTVKLPLSSILYIESMSDYLKIHTSDQIYLTKEKISVIEQKLPPEFLRIHRSFIINTRHLRAFSPEMVELGGQELPISRSMRHQVLEVLQED
jgi:DNA-binding LytR/AlgR family response regulator